MTVRKQYTDDAIRDAFRASDGTVKGCTAIFNQRWRGSNRPEVSRQLMRFWLQDLGLHTPTPLAQAVRKALPKAVVHGGPRILSIDIETAPIEAYVWSLWKQNVGLNQITTEWTILSYCAKWLHEGDPIYDDCSQLEDVRNDRHLLEGLWRLLDEADIVITQNGKRFDVPKINARFVLLGFPVPRPYKVIDTMLIAKQQFGFTSKKLEWMTDKLCVQHKKNTHAKFPGFALWAECLKGNQEAWAEMREYNIPDVLSMEELYLVMRPWFVGHPNVAIYFKDDEPKCRCPKCGSDNIKQDGWTFTQTGKYEQMHCGNCGGWSRGRYTRNTMEERRVQFSN